VLQIRNPKAEGRKKAEIRSPNAEKMRGGRRVGQIELRDKGSNSPAAAARLSFGFRISVFGLLSGFGLRASDFRSIVVIGGAA